MIKSRRIQLLIGLIFVCACSLVRSAEPNEAKTELKFEISDDEQKWTHDLDDETGYYDKDNIDKDGIIPTHVAIMIIKHVRVPRIYWTDISDSPIGRTMSQQQQEFITKANGRIRNLHGIGEGFEFRWYAVSQEDAKKMAQAFIDIWDTKVDMKLQPVLNNCKELEETITGVKKETLEKETEINNLTNKLKEVQKNVHYLSHEEARKTIEELNKTLDELNIDISGMQVKVRAIAEEHVFQSKKTHGQGDAQSVRRRKIYEATIWPRLEQMRIDQIIDLKVAEAKKATAMKIRDAAEEFYNLHMQRNKIPNFLGRLRRDLSNYQKSLQSARKKLANPTPDMLPPKVYQNKVTIYPVK